MAREVPIDILCRDSRGAETAAYLQFRRFRTAENSDERLGQYIRRLG
jgi:hypothetical protein